MPDAAINRTPAGWPYLDDQNYIDIIDDYSRELANKLENSDADIAAAVNAATKAQQAASAVNALVKTITIPFLVAGTTDANALLSVSIPWHSGITPATPIAVVLQDAMTSLAAGPVWARWNVVATTAATLAIKVFQSPANPLPNYGVRFAALVVAPASLAA